VRRLARVLLAAGIAGTVLGLSLLHAARNGYVFQGSFRFGWALTYIGVLSVAAYAVGLPDLPRRRSRLLTAAAATALGAGTISLLQLFLGDALLPRLVVFGSAALLVPWLMVCAAVAAGGRARAEERDRIVVVGDFDEGATLQLELDDAPERPAQVVDVVRLDAARGAEGEEPLIDRVIAANGTVLVLSRAAQDDLRLVDQAAVLHEAGVRVRTLSKFYEDWLGKLPIGELERVSLMFDIGEVHGDRYSRVKRLLDVVCGAAGVLLLLPVLLLVAAGNRVGNRGRLFYRQERVGRDGRRFTIVKFRTMRPGDGRLANEWTQEDDPRITPFGRFLRTSHLDELPQVLNILRGDLSLVGPRPEQPQYVDELREKIPFYDLRHLVRPGLTGWAQVKFGYAGDERDALEKLQYEFFYLRHQSLGLDLRIVGRTLRELVVGRNGR
jgi:lipopolysaccharide/colanic/teichoic acid biosynthesis glycosyltransferase